MLTYAIDFGTSNSLLAAAEPGKLHPPIPLDPHSEDPSILRSVVYFISEHEIYYGSQATKQYLERELQGRLLRSMKRFLPNKSFIGTQIGRRFFSIEELIASFLREMRSRGNEHFKKDCDRVVLGRPAIFSANPAEDALAQTRLEAAAKLAGFKEISFVPEPVAAAREFRHQLKDEKLVLVVDLGGGTSDYTLVKLGPRPFKKEDVLSVGGVPMAGDAFDGSVMRHKVSPHFGSKVEYQVPFGSNVIRMPVFLMERLCSPAELAILQKREIMEFFRNVQQWALSTKDQSIMDQLFSLIENQLGFSIFESIEHTKRELSQKQETLFQFKYPDISIQEKITRGEFNSFTQEVSGKIMRALDETLHAAQVKPEEVDILCCTGGTAKVPVIRSGLIERFGEEKVREHKTFQSVVEGLADVALDSYNVGG